MSQSHAKSIGGRHGLQMSTTTLFADVDAFEVVDATDVPVVSDELSQLVPVAIIDLGTGEFLFELSTLVLFSNIMLGILATPR